MVSISEALEIAKSLHDCFDYVTEYENAFVFSEYDDDSDGGSGPCAVMISDGRALDFVYALETDILGNEVAHGYIEDVIA